MIPLPYKLSRDRPISEREAMAHARSRRRQRRRWFRAWLREGMPGYWDVYESKRQGDHTLATMRRWR